MKLKSSMCSLHNKHLHRTAWEILFNLLITVIFFFDMYKTEHHTLDVLQPVPYTYKYKLSSALDTTKCHT